MGIISELKYDVAEIKRNTDNVKVVLHSVKISAQAENSAWS